MVLRYPALAAVLVSQEARYQCGQAANTQQPWQVEVADVMEHPLQQVADQGRHTEQVVQQLVWATTVATEVVAVAAVQLVQVVAVVVVVHRPCSLVPVRLMQQH